MGEKRSSHTPIPKRTFIFLERPKKQFPNSNLEFTSSVAFGSCGILFLFRKESQFESFAHACTRLPALAHDDRILHLFGSVQHDGA